MEKNLSQTQGTSEELNRTLREMNRTLETLGRTLKNTRGQGQNMLTTFSQLVFTISNVANVTRGLVALKDFALTFSAGFKQLSAGVLETGGAFEKAKAIVGLFFETLTKVGGDLNTNIRNNETAAKGYNALGRSVSSINKQIGGFIRPTKAAGEETEKFGRNAGNAARTERALAEETQKTSKIMEVMKDETGAVNLELITGTQVAQFFSNILDRMKQSILGTKDGLRGAKTETQALTEAIQQSTLAAAESGGKFGAGNAAATGFGVAIAAAAGVALKFNTVVGALQGRFPALANGLVQAKTAVTGYSNALLASVSAEKLASDGNFRAAAASLLVKDSLDKLGQKASAAKTSVAGFTDTVKTNTGAIKNNIVASVQNLQVQQKAGAAAVTLKARALELVTAFKSSKFAKEQETKSTKENAKAAVETYKSMRAAQDGTSRLNAALFALSRGLETSSNKFAKFALANRVAMKLLKVTVVDTVKNFDDIAAASFRLNKAIGGGGFFGGPKFVGNLTTMITLTTALTAAMTAGAGAIIGLAQKAGNAAEAINAVAVTLGNAGPEFERLIGDTTQLGLSGTKMRQAITPIVPLLKNAGLSGDELASSLNEIIRRGVDLSSIFNNDVTQSLGAMAAGIRGEIEPLERLGVAFNANEVESKAAALGFEKVDGQLAESAKQFARLQIIMEKSSFAQDDFVNTSDSLANSQRILGASFDDLISTISASFLPAAQKLVQIFLKLVAENGPAIKEFFTVLQPLLVRYAELFAELAGVASRTAGILATAILPSLKALGVILNAVSPLVTGFITKFFILNVAKMVLEGFSGALALFVPRVMGASAAVLTLSNSLGAFVRPVGMALLLMGLFSQATNTASDGLLGGLGKALKFIEPLVRVLLFRFIAMKAVPLIMSSINVAVAQLTGGLALAAGVSAGLSATLMSLAGPIAIAITAFSLFKSEVKDTSEVLKALEHDTVAIQLEKFVEFADLPVDVGDTIGTFWDEVILMQENEIDRHDKRISAKVREGLEEIFFSDPGKAEALVVEAERQRVAVSGELRTVLNDLIFRERERTLELRTGTMVLKERIEEEKRLRDIFDDAVSLVESFISAGAALTSANRGLQTANKTLASATKTLSDIEKERVRILDDTISEAQELIDAQEALLRIGWRLRDLEQERISILEDLLELQTPASADELAAADRSVERAKIALNRAIRQEKEALAELNAEQAVSVDLSGLSVDQIKSRLSNIRAVLRAQQSTKKSAKSQEEIDEEITSNRLDTLDAVQALKDTEKEREEIQNRVLLNAPDIRELEERLLELAIDKADAMVEQEDSQERINDLKAGETTLSRELTALEERRAGAADQVKNAQEAVAAASLTVTVAAKEHDVIQARITKNKEAERTAQLELLEAKGKQAGLNISDEATLQRHLTLLGLQADKIREMGSLPKFQITGPEIPDVLQGTKFEHIVNSGLIGGGLAQQAISALAAALLETQELRTFFTSGGAKAQFQGGLIEGSPGPWGQLIRAGEHGFSELVLPFQRDPLRAAHLLARYAPGVADIATGRIPQIDVSATPGPRITKARASYVSPNKPSRLEQRLDRLIQLQLESNSKNYEINAPITVSGAPNAELTARRTARELRKMLDSL